TASITSGLRSTDNVHEPHRPTLEVTARGATDCLQHPWGDARRQRLQNWVYRTRRLQYEVCQRNGAESAVWSNLLCSEATPLIGSISQFARANPPAAEAPLIKRAAWVLIATPVHVEPSAQRGRSAAFLAPANR